MLKNENQKIILKPWASKCSECQSCGTKRYSHAGRGYCYRCYRLLRKMEKVQAWDYKDRSTWYELPDSAIVMIKNKENLERIRKGYLTQIQGRLNQLRGWEDKRKGQVDALALEYEFRNLAFESGARKGWYIHSHYANILRDTFTPKQWQELYKLLNDIRQAKPWKGVNWYKIIIEK